MIVQMDTEMGRIRSECSMAGRPNRSDRPADAPSPPTDMSSEKHDRESYVPDSPTLRQATVRV